jgi:hypothetical protein
MKQIRLFFLLAIVAVLGISFSHGAPARKDEKKNAKAESKTVALLKKLQQPITMENGIDANTPLKDAVAFISDHFGIKIVIDCQAFKDEGLDDGGPGVEASPVKLPKLTDIPLRTALRLLLSQVPPKGATFLVRRDFVEITTVNAARPEHLFRHKVTAVFDKTPLEEALQELSEDTGVSVILDVRVQEAAATPVTATLKNDVSIETAVRVLADMAGLKAVRVGGALYVTTKDNAALLQAQEAKKSKTAKTKPNALEKPKADTAKPSDAEKPKGAKPK